VLESKVPRLSADVSKLQLWMSGTRSAVAAVAGSEQQALPSMVVKGHRRFPFEKHLC